MHYSSVLIETKLFIQDINLFNSIFRFGIWGKMISCTHWRGIQIPLPVWPLALMGPSYYQIRWTIRCESGIFDLSLLKSVASKWWLATLIILKRFELWFFYYLLLVRFFNFLKNTFRTCSVALGLLMAVKFLLDRRIVSSTYGTQTLAVLFTNYLATMEALMT